HTHTHTLVLPSLIITHTHSLSHTHKHTHTHTHTLSLSLSHTHTHTHTHTLSLSLSHTHTHTHTHTCYRWCLLCMGFISHCTVGERVLWESSVAGERGPSVQRSGGEATDRRKGDGKNKCTEKSGTEIEP